jgi:hypothetical protein
VLHCLSSWASPSTFAISSTLVFSSSAAADSVVSFCLLRCLKIVSRERCHSELLAERSKALSFIAPPVSVSVPVSSLCESVELLLLPASYSPASSRPSFRRRTLAARQRVVFIRQVAFFLHASPTTHRRRRDGETSIKKYFRRSALKICKSKLCGQRKLGGRFDTTLCAPLVTRVAVSQFLLYHHHRVMSGHQLGHTREAFVKI